MDAHDNAFEAGFPSDVYIERHTIKVITRSRLKPNGHFHTEHSKGPKENHYGVSHLWFHDSNPEGQCRHILTACRTEQQVLRTEAAVGAGHEWLVMS